MLIGTYQHTMDPKGRVIIPAKFREDLGEKFVITRGFDKCLYLYPMQEWKKFVDKLKSLPTSKQQTRKILRHFFSGATECEPDSQGRILVPQNLRDHALLDKELTLIGQMNKVEVWDSGSLAETEVENIDELAEELDIEF